MNIPKSMAKMAHDTNTPCMYIFQERGGTKLNVNLVVFRKGLDKAPWWDFALNKGQDLVIIMSSVTCLVTF